MEIKENIVFKTRTTEEGFVKAKIVGASSKNVYHEVDLSAKLAIALGNSLVRSGKGLLRQGEFKR